MQPVVTVTSSVQEADAVLTVFKIQNESHTVGNLLQVRINNMADRDPRIMYIAYTRRHPLENFISIKIRTPSFYDAVEILVLACDQVLNDVRGVLSQTSITPQE